MFPIIFHGSLLFVSSLKYLIVKYLRHSRWCYQLKKRGSGIVKYTGK